MVKEKLKIVWEINVKRIWGDIKMVKAYLLWSIDGLAAAPHCGIVSAFQSLQLLTLSIITFSHPFHSYSSSSPFSSLFSFPFLLRYVHFFSQFSLFYSTPSLPASLLLLLLFPYFNQLIS